VGVSVAICDTGRIVEAVINVPKLIPYTTAKIIKPEDALSLLQSYLGNPVDFYKDNPGCLFSGPYSEVHSITIKYFCMLSLDSSQPLYAQPVYVVSTDLRRSMEYDYGGRVDGLVRETL